MSEPEAVNTLVIESESLRESVFDELGRKPPEAIAHFFKDTSFLFQNEVLAQWRIAERFDELIEYIVYQYGEGGGENLWKQVLLDLRLKKDEKRALALLKGLLTGRMAVYKANLRNSKKHPDNYISSANLEVSKGEVARILFEYAFIVANKPEDEVDYAEVVWVNGQIDKLVKK